jgi:hypothetical protein
VSAEVPFVISVSGTLIRGSIDLLVERSDGSLMVVDYKTDRLEGRQPEGIVSRYAVQRDLYALAAAARGGPVETAYLFLERAEAPVTAVFDEDALEQARARVEELLRRLAAGRFDVTHHPHRSLCLDCPARERLCSHEPVAQLRDDPDPPVEPGGRRERSSVQGSEGGSEPQLSLLEEA